MSTLSQFGGGGIKSIQRGSIDVAVASTATITAVDTNKAILYHLGETFFDSSYSSTGGIRLELTNSTTITAYKRGTYTTPSTVGFQVVEYY